MPESLRSQRDGCGGGGEDRVPGRFTHDDGGKTPGPPWYTVSAQAMLAFVVHNVLVAAVRASKRKKRERRVVPESTTEFGRVWIGASYSFLARGQACSWDRKSHVGRASPLQRARPVLPLPGLSSLQGASRSISGPHMGPNRAGRGIIDGLHMDN